MLQRLLQLPLYRSFSTAPLISLVEKKRKQTEWLKCGHYSKGGRDRKNAQVSEVRLTQ